jgi:hypothetical protein
MEKRVVTEIARERGPANGCSGRTLSPFDPDRFRNLSETEILSRIGVLLASALLRSGRLSRPTERGVGGIEGAASSVIAQEDLICDPVARRVARFLQIAGPSTPGEVAINLGIPRRTLARKLHLLRSNGLCTVAGKTRTARYALRTDYAAN